MNDWIKLNDIGDTVLLGADPKLWNELSHALRPIINLTTFHYKYKDGTLI